MSPRHILLPLAALAVSACGDRSPIDSGPIPAAVSVAPDSLFVRLGQTASLAPEVLDARGHPVVTTHLRYASNHPEIVSVDSLTGRVTPVAQGTAEIRVTARPAEARVPVTVMPPGGGDVAAFGLDFDRSLLDPVHGPMVQLERWSLVPAAIRYHASNAAGESLCGLVPLTILAGPMVTAVVARSGDPCRITLFARSEGAGWLRIASGAKRDSVWMEVRPARYRWTVDLPRGPHAAGSTVQARAEVREVPGRPAEGVTFLLELTDDGLVGFREAVTGPDGTAQISWTLPTSTLETTQSADSLARGFQGGHFVVAAFVNVEGRGTGGSAEILLQPAAPDHIELFAYRVNRYVYCTPVCIDPVRYSDVWTQYRLLTGDPVVMTSFDRDVIDTECTGPEIFCPMPPRWEYIDKQLETLVVAVVVDRFGNPTAVVPELQPNAAGATITEVREGFISGVSVPCCEWTRRSGSRAAVTSLSGGFGPVLLTFTAPGVPSRSVTVWGQRPA